MESPPKEIDRAIERKKRFLHRRLFEGKPERLKILEEARANEEIARKIFSLRTQGGVGHGCGQTETLFPLP